MADNEAQRAEVNALMELSEEALLRKLGVDLFGNQAMTLDPRDLQDRAKRFLEGQRSDLRLRICGSSALKSFAAGKSDTAEIAIEIAKLVSSLVLPVSPIVLAVILAKKGLKELCPTWGMGP